MSNCQIIEPFFGNLPCLFQIIAGEVHTDFDNRGKKRLGITTKRTFIKPKYRKAYDLIMGFARNKLNIIVELLKFYSLN